MAPLQKCVIDGCGINSSLLWYPAKSIIQICYIYQVIDRYIQDLRGNKHFWKALVLLAEDFRQTLSIIPRSTPAYVQNIEHCGDKYKQCN